MSATCAVGDRRRVASGPTLGGGVQMGEHQTFEAARRRRMAPLAVAVSGHPGVGTQTVAAALRSRFRLCCTVIGDADPPGGADLLVRVIGAGARRCDVRACRVQAPLIVVAGKADVRDDARAAAAEAAGVLGRPVVPVSALWASATVGPSALDALRTGEPGDDVLRSYGIRGVAAAQDWLAAEPLLSGAAIATRLHDASGIDAVADAVRTVSGEVASLRDRRLCADLRLIAARGAAREEAEQALVGVHL
ncbi:hypothetical protein L5I01_18205 [Gordonia sp. HY442]|uniref:hypothetical protein n=1 Tax=Gordonia zhenghanii TaxID=2911516 RepID=UPI001F3496AA|nr:hypothetical protein [Gordonia zhenghanii]MCF8605287.1 hypothetical protein [Gordonia zhenghanii]